MEYYASLQSDGRIESFEPVLLWAHGGDLNGFIIVRGDAEKLAGVEEDERFFDIMAEADYCLEGAGVVRGDIGESITNSISRWSKLFAE
jgi:hypothetical protein